MLDCDGSYFIFTIIYEIHLPEFECRKFEDEYRKGNTEHDFGSYLNNIDPTNVWTCPKVIL